MLLSTVVVSCSHRCRFQKNERNYIPYKGNELLIFQSDKNNTDTIYIDSIKQGLEECIGGSLELFPDHCEALRVYCSSLNPLSLRSRHCRTLVEFATKKGVASFFFDIKLKGAWFYSLHRYTVAEFNQLPETQLIIGDAVYKDVKVFEADDYAQQFIGRDNYAERFYWSVSKGFLGLDKKDEKWRLVKLYTQ